MQRQRLVVSWSALLMLASAAPAQQQFAEVRYTREQVPPAVHQAGTYDVAAGDVDRDGDSDLLVGTGDPLAGGALWRNDGHGRFVDATTVHASANRDATIEAHLADLDGDGDLDAIFSDVCVGCPVTFCFEARVAMYRNDGSGVFSAYGGIAVPGSSDPPTAHLAFGDVDNDGDLDLVAAASRGQVHLYLNDGAGTFAEAPLASNVAYYRGAALEDVDGDQDLDLVAIATLAGQTRLWLNDGGGGFAEVTATHMPVDRDNTEAVSAGDVDRDGDVDLILANTSGPNRLYLNDGTGRFVDATATRLPRTATNASHVELGDVDGDADLDVFLYAFDHDALWLNDGTGVFVDASAQLPTGIGAPQALVDVDGDGDLDVVGPLLWLNDGAGVFIDVYGTPRAQVGTSQALLTSIAVADVDGDRDPDVVLGNGHRYSLVPSSGEPNLLLLNDGRGFFREVPLPAATDLTMAVAFGDVDGDGDADIAFGNDGQNRLLLGDGGGGFAEVTATHLPVDADVTTALAFSDVDADGDLDLVLANRLTQNRLYLNDGAGVFVDGTGPRMPVDAEQTSDVAVGDVDADGDPDLLVSNGAFRSGQRQQNHLYLNDGTGRFTDGTAGRLPLQQTSTLALALADVDADGDIDVMQGEQQQNRLLINDGAGRFFDATATKLGTSAGPTLDLAFGDLDGDGDLDVVLARDSEDRGLEDRLLLNDGSGAFVDATARMPVEKDATNGIALLDIDGDGDLDVAGANSTFYESPSCGGGQQGRLKVLVNGHRGIYAPFVPRPGHPHVVRLSAKPGYAAGLHAAVPFLALAAASPPLAVPPYGTFFLDPRAWVVLPPVAIPSATAQGELRFVVPRVPGLAGLAFYTQAWIVDLTDPADAHLTGYLEDTVLR